MHIYRSCVHISEQHDRESQVLLVPHTGPGTLSTENVHDSNFVNLFNGHRTQ